MCVLLFYLAILNRKTADFFGRLGEIIKTVRKATEKARNIKARNNNNRNFMLFMFFRNKQNWGERKYKNMYLGKIF